MVVFHIARWKAIYGEHILKNEIAMKTGISGGKGETS
jgi:hypothetical protein